MPEANPLVAIRGLSKVYERGHQKVEVLHHVDLDIPAGDFLALWMCPVRAASTSPAGASIA